jgi:hypothetical protein
MHSCFYVFTVALLLLLPQVAPEGEDNENEAVIFSPSFITAEPFIILLDVLPQTTKVRAELSDGERTCSKIWNGEKWVHSDAPWAEMPEPSNRIFLKFHPYSNTTLDSVRTLRIRFRMGDKNTDWIEMEVKRAKGGKLEGYAEKDGKPLENEEIRIYRGRELFAILLSEQNPMYDFEGRGYFTVTLQPGSYYLKYREKNIPFVIKSNETTCINTEHEDVRINELCYLGDEWIELKNFEDKAVSLEEWYITDRDYFNITLTESIADLYLVDLFSLFERAVMVDSGDDVMLVDDFGRVVDFIAYGSSGYVDPPPQGFSELGVLDVPCAKGESIALIDGAYRAARATRGMPNDIEIRKKFSYDRAEPFLSPGDSFDRVMSLLEGAKERVYISTYKFSSLPVYYALLDKQEKGVDVKLIMGQESPMELKIPYVIAGKPLNHAKYAVIDDLFLVSSENFDENGLPVAEGNRGWWILFEGSDIALYNLFVLDWNNALGEVMNCADVNTGRASTGKLLISPENSFTEIIALINSAQNEIYAEQLYISNRDVIKALERAIKRGVKVRIVLDNRSELDVDGAEVIFKENVHNKAIIVDGNIVLVSSINLSDSSLFENREVGVILYDRDVAKYFYEKRIS